MKKKHRSDVYFTMSTIICLIFFAHPVDGRYGHNCRMGVREINYPYG